MITLEFRNQPLGGLRIIKLDSVTKKPLEGVQFRITYSDGSFVADEGGKLSSNGLYMTDANGEILIRDIVGTLVVTEVKRSLATPSMKPQEARPSLLTPTIFRL